MAETDYIHDRFMAPRDMDTVLLFNENVSTPVASISMKDIPTTTLHNIISSNQFLALPRLSSQSVLEELCPCAWNKPKMKICVALVTEDSTDHDPHRLAFRQYAEKFPFGTERVRFTYIYHQRQSLFINALRKGSNINVWLNVLIHFGIIRRRLRGTDVESCGVLETGQLTR